MQVHLVDGTYELFRHFYALPSATDAEGHQIGAARGVLNSIQSMLRSGATHIGVATDQVIESFRNDLWPGYKTGSGIDPNLLAQFQLLEETLMAYGVATWPMLKYEADDALAAAALLAAADSSVERIFICTPDKDLSQCVCGTRIVQLDRRKRLVRDEAGVVAKFGVVPKSIPDYLALVGDSADGYPGLKGWGAKSAAALLSRYKHLESIPLNPKDWPPGLSNVRALSEVLSVEMDKVLLFRDLATLRTDIPLFDSVDQLRWKSPMPEFELYERRFRSATIAKPVPR